MKRCHALFALLALASGGLPGAALAWEPFRSENSRVREGNEHMAKGQLPEALNAYNEAAKQLPNEPGVHLDRGLALLKSGKPAEAREALRIASQGNASKEVRGAANYNLGLAFMQEADELAKKDDLEGAQKLLRESADAFKSSLRASPGNRDAAWNMELSKRRIVELEKKQQEKKQQEEQKKKDEQKKQDEQNQDQQQQNDDQQNSDAQKSDDDQKKDGQNDPQKKEDQQADGGATPEPQQGEQDGGTQKPEPEKKPGESQDEQEPTPAPPQPQMPEHMQKALDALEDGEENLQKHRAAQRARQRPRRIEKDW